MKTTITVSAFAVKVSIAGVSIRINRDELFDSIDTIQKFIVNIWPDKRKEDLEDSGFNKVCNLIKQYQPIAERLLACYKFEGTAKSILTINEDGTINGWSNEQNVTIDVKGIMQCASDFSSFYEENAKEPESFSMDNDFDESVAADNELTFQGKLDASRQRYAECQLQLETELAEEAAKSEAEYREWLQNKIKAKHTGKINLNGTPVVATGINEEETE